MLKLISAGCSLQHSLFESLSEVNTSLVCYLTQSKHEISASEIVFPVLFQAYKYIKTMIPPEPDRHRYGLCSFLVARILVLCVSLKTQKWHRLSSQCFFPPSFYFFKMLSLALVHCCCVRNKVIALLHSFRSLPVPYIKIENQSHPLCGGFVRHPYSTAVC